MGGGGWVLGAGCWVHGMGLAQLFFCSCFLFQKWTVPGSARVLGGERLRCDVCTILKSFSHKLDYLHFKERLKRRGFLHCGKGMEMDSVALFW